MGLGRFFSYDFNFFYVMLLHLVMRNGVNFMQQAHFVDYAKHENHLGSTVLKITDSAENVVWSLKSQRYYISETREVLRNGIRTPIFYITWAFLLFNFSYSWLALMLVYINFTMQRLTNPVTQQSVETFYGWFFKKYVQIQSVMWAHVVFKIEEKRVKWMKMTTK